jgi:aspartate/methionine/tyrosine aminotransferase
VHPDEVAIVPGGKPIMYFAMTALVEEGDEVIYPDPGFPIYESMIRFLGARPVPVRLREERQFRMDVDEVAALLNRHTRLVIINSPQNPTGAVMTQDDVRRLARALNGSDALVLSDEIYCRILFDAKHYSILSEPGMKERTILLDGFSKTYAMTGWRLGYGVMPRELARATAQLMVNSNSCTAAFTQLAGVEALRGDQTSVTKMVNEFRRRRDLMVDRLNQIAGFHCVLPQGAFYVFPNIRETGLSARELQNHLLEEAGVAALAGTAFGAGGEGYLRFSVANSVENIGVALERIATWINSRRSLQPASAP